MNFHHPVVDHEPDLLAGAIAWLFIDSTRSAVGEVLKDAKRAAPARAALLARRAKCNHENTKVVSTKRISTLL